MTTTTNAFAALGLIAPLVRGVADEGYTEPTPIQRQAIPEVLAKRDLLGIAQTGTGKTASFALPILQRLVELGRRPHGDRPIAVLVLAPTRELAAQIGDSFAAYGRHLGYKHAVIFGGVGQAAQERALRSGLDILVATPGRLLDLSSQRLVHFHKLDIFVLDEADRMLDMGFIHDVKKIIALLPSVRQTLFFSATMPPEAQKLADAILRNPVTVAVTPPATTVELIDQRVMFVEKNDKRALLAHLFGEPSLKRALVFSRTKHGANRIAEWLDKAGVAAAAIHGNKSQNAREAALKRFKTGELRALVATDIAARGIDIDDVTHVINFDLPEVPETYVHRIGRTARAGASGRAIAFCEAEDRVLLRDIQRLIGREIPVNDQHPYRSTVPMHLMPAPPPRGGGQQRQQNRGGRHQGQRPGADHHGGRHAGHRTSSDHRGGPRAASPPASAGRPAGRPAERPQGEPRAAPPAAGGLGVPGRGARHFGPRGRRPR